MDHKQHSYKERSIIYICPMHPEVKRDRPGICPECGMNLVPIKDRKKSEGAEHDKHAGHSTAMFLRKFWVSLALTVPVVLYSNILKTLFDFVPPVFTGSRHIPFIFGSIVFFFGGWGFLLGARPGLKARNPGLMTLIRL